MNTSDILTRAADLIEKRGHHKGWYCGPNGSLCTFGAVYAATGIEPQPYELCQGQEDKWPGWHLDGHKAADDAMDRLGDELSVGYVPDWNDADERTADEVVAALRRAAGGAS